MQSRCVMMESCCSSISSRARPNTSRGNSGWFVVSSNIFCQSEDRTVFRGNIHLPDNLNSRCRYQHPSVLCESTQARAGRLVLRAAGRIFAPIGL
jgi:hypothetical protein